MAVDFIRRPSVLSSGSRRRSAASAAAFDSQAEEIKRRQSVKYQFPTFAFDEEEEATLFNEANVKEENIRREIFGPPLSEVSMTYLDTTVNRPTTASARRSVLWSRERKTYEEESKLRMQEFRQSPYMKHQYPEINKHYPGTWRVVKSQELSKIVQRLSRPTTASNIRAQSAPLLRRKQRHKQVRIQTSF